MSQTKRLSKDALRTAADAALRQIAMESAARLVEVMIDEKPWCDHLMARGALTLAAHVVRRGRHLTATEKLENLATALDDGSKQGKRAAENIRQRLRPQTPDR